MLMRSLVTDVLDGVYQELVGDCRGAVADYIPELAVVDPDSFAICLSTCDGTVYEVGDSRKRFAIQSISKPFSYALALADQGLAAVAERVDVEPSGEAFNEISLDPITERPRNPMINAGAITATSLVTGATADERFERIRSFYSKFAGRELTLDDSMFASEDRTGHRNRAIGYMLRSFGILEEDPELTLDVYFRQCSIEVDCRDLSLMAATLACSGVHPISGERVLHPALTERVLSVMTTCGMYNAAGDWVTEVGLPAKSGVGGGILAVLPGQIGLAVFSPRLDGYGNSLRGVAACRRISRDLELHVMHVSRAARSVVRASRSVLEAPSRRQRRPGEQAVLRQYGKRARVYELLGDLQFAGVESVIREISLRADKLDVIVLDVRGVDDVAVVARRLLLDLRNELLESGCDAVLVDPHQALLQSQVADADENRRVRRFDDLNSAIEFAEDIVISRYADPGVAVKAIEVHDHPLITALSAEHRAGLVGRLLIRHYEHGDQLVRVTQEPQGLFLILSGMVDMSIAAPGAFDRRRHHLSTFTVGTTFGVVYALARQPYEIDAHAVGPVRAAVLEMTALDQLSDREPDLMLSLLRTLVSTEFSNLNWIAKSLAAPE
jgi:glutaminase